MKKLLPLMILLSLMLTGCKNQKVPVDNTCTDTVYYHTPVIDTGCIDTVYIEVVKQVEVIPSEFLEYKLIVLNVKHYVDITEARPANKTYFYGWIRRAMEGVPDLLSRDQQKFGQ